MMLYPVKREGPRNKDDPELVVEDVDLEELVEEKVSIHIPITFSSLTHQPAETRSQLLLDLSLQPQHPQGSRHPVQSPPEINTQSNPFEYSEYETPEKSTPSQPRAPSPTLQERIEATKAKINKLKIKLARDPIEVRRGIDPAHIPTEHRPRSRARSRTRVEDYAESSTLPSIRTSHPRSREEYYGVTYKSSSRPSESRQRNVTVGESSTPSSGSSTYRPSSRSSRTSRDEDHGESSRPSSRSSTRSQTKPARASVTSQTQIYSDYLSPHADSSMAPPRRSSSPTPSISSLITPTPSESGADDMEDPEQTPKAGRNGWVALQDVLL